MFVARRCHCNFFCLLVYLIILRSWQNYNSTAKYTKRKKFFLRLQMMRNLIAIHQTFVSFIELVHWEILFILPSQVLLLLTIIKYFADSGRAIKVEVLWWSRPRGRVLSGHFCYSECWNVTFCSNHKLGCSSCRDVSFISTAYYSEIQEILQTVKMK